MQDLGELELVEWIDADQDGDWVDVDEVTGAPSVVLTVGWLLREDALTLSLACCRGVGDDTDVGGVWTIPVAVILRRTKVALP